MKIYLRFHLLGLFTVQSLQFTTYNQDKITEENNLFTDNVLQNLETINKEFDKSRRQGFLYLNRLSLSRIEYLGAVRGMPFSKVVEVYFL